MGRQTQQLDYLDTGEVAYQRDADYDDAGRVTIETSYTRYGTSLYKNVVTNDYGSGAGYALGTLVSSTTKAYKDNVDADAADTSLSYSFNWWDGAVQASSSYDPDTAAAGPLNTTSFVYDGLGRLASVRVDDGRARTIDFVNDAAGQAIRRDEADGDTNAGDPHDLWYRFAGRQLGAVGNNGTLETEYKASVLNRLSTQPGKVLTTGAFRFDTTTDAHYADFAQGADPINSYMQGSGAGSYTVRSGDTLQGIAAALWGDGSLWYRLAEANGLGGGPSGCRQPPTSGRMADHRGRNSNFPFKMWMRLPDVCSA